MRRTASKKLVAATRMIAIFDNPAIQLNLFVKGSHLSESVICAVRVLCGRSCHSVRIGGKVEFRRG
jgi:hypothetical protein